MPRYWVIAPVESKPAALFDKVWKFDLANNLISIGWSKLGDVSKMTREDLFKAIANTYRDKPATTIGLYANMILSFYHDILPNDIVIARRGRKTLAAVGKVIQAAIYSPGKNADNTHPNYLSVEWQDQPRNKNYSDIVFKMQTLAEISEVEYHNILEGSGPQPITPESNESVEDPNEFVLEKYLEDFIVSNFDTIFKGKYKIYEDSEENEGQQYDTNDIGKIDILAIESRTNSFIVIELKKGRPSDQVIGQILRYMGWVKKNLCKNDQKVKGLVICRDPDPKLSYAIEMTNNIDVRYYNVSFKLKETP
jgi:restriction system protein